MRMDKFTTLFQSALADAQSLAVGNEQQFIEPVHLITTMLAQPQGLVKPLLQKAGVRVEPLQKQLDEIIKRLPQVNGTPGEVYPSKELVNLLNVTEQIASKEFHDQYIASELFVLAALNDKGALGDALRAAGADKKALKKAIEEMRGGQKVDNPDKEQQYQALQKYTRDYTKEAEDGKLDPVIGRDDEIRRYHKYCNVALKIIQY